MDDERINREMLSRLLHRNGHQTITAPDGEEAIGLVESEPIDMVLLDIVMPVVDGFEVLSRLRSMKSAVELPVIMVTADNDTTQVVKALRQGANDFVTKPIDPDVTIARINTHLHVRTLQKALMHSEERYALASQGANDGLWDWELASNHVYFSPRWKRMLGIAEDDPICCPEDWFLRAHNEDRQRVQQELEAHLSNEIPHFEVEFRMLHQDGCYRWMLCRGLAVRDDRGKATRIAGSLTDITEGKVADALTGLPNRLLFRDRLQRTIDRSEMTAGVHFAVLYFDLDNFKLVNDSLGHTAGDQLLIGVAQRLEGCVRACESIVARIGGDEFAILLENIRSQSEAEQIAMRVTQAISTPFTIGGGREVFTTASIGISYAKHLCANADDLLREADTAMYEAKHLGKSQFQVFNPNMHEEANLRLDLESELRRALERDEIYVNYQPIVDLASGDFLGFEALARWRHPRLGVVPPVQFIPIAEETGLICLLGEQILFKACEQMGVWQKQFPICKAMTFNVNLSAKQLSQRGLSKTILTILERASVSPSALRIEITESAIMENLNDGVNLLETLRGSGIRVEIDDFGTGYSSLSLLHKLPLDVLKIDRTFISKLFRSHENTAIVKTILALAESLELEVIAEGIETEEQRQLLLSMGCRYGQGYLFARPLEVDQMEERLRAETGRQGSQAPSPQQHSIPLIECPALNNVGLSTTSIIAPFDAI